MANNTVVFFGDSYIGKLREFWNDDATSSPHLPVTPQWFTKDDLRTSQIYSGMLWVQPLVVFISLGANDISPTSSPKEIFNQICNIVEDIRATGAQYVLIGAILPRADVTNCNFEKQRLRINSLLAKKYKGDLIKFADIRHPQDYCADGIHLKADTAERANCGMRKYAIRLSRVICSRVNSATYETSTERARLEKGNGTGTYPTGASIIPDMMQQRSISTTSVAFTAQLTHSMTNVRLGTTIKYDQAIYNKGNAYSTSSGIFTCPTSGVYLFSFTAESFDETTLDLGLKLDGQLISVAISEAANQAGHDTTGTAVLIIYVRRGQEVWIETRGGTDNTGLWSTYNTFAGVLFA